MKAGDCKHFTGIQNDRCKAGVRYLDVRDSSGTGPYRWPCVPGSRPCSTVCSSFAAVTAEEEAATMAEWVRIESVMLTGKCPTCGKDLEKSGNVVFCKPCDVSMRICSGEDLWKP